MKKICVITGTRADYGLLYSPIKEMQALGLAVDIVATGSHLSEKHGRTIDMIKADGFKISEEVDLEIEGDRPKDICKSMSLALNKFSNYFEINCPDLLLVLGDRYEIFAAVAAAVVHNIPVGHIHGGEVTQGAIDDSFRHAITKMSHLHFTSSPQYYNRVIQLGEAPETVFCTGAPGLDNIKNIKLLSKIELETVLDVKFNTRNVLVTFHPVTVSEKQTEIETNNFFNALSMLDNDISFYITLPNADTFSSSIFVAIEEFRKKHSSRVYTFKSLGQLKYLSLMKQVDVVAGNSSSGIIEAPFMSKAVINVGNRQKGRSASKHVINVGGEQDEIIEGFKLALSSDFQKKLATFETIYGEGDSGVRIAKIINSLKIHFPKKFHDVNL